MAASYAGAFPRRTPRIDNFAPLNPTQRRLLTGARHVARYMDARFSIFGFRFGFDSIIGIVPGLGDVVSAVASVYLLWVGVQLRLPGRKLLRMLLNAAADLGMGIVPVVGDVADAVFKSHMRNLRIIEEHVRRVESVYDTHAVRR